MQRPLKGEIVLHKGVVKEKLFVTLPQTKWASVFQQCWVSYVFFNCTCNSNSAPLEYRGLIWDEAILRSSFLSKREGNASQVYGRMRRSTTVSSETYLLYSFVLFMNTRSLNLVYLFICQYIHFHRLNIFSLLVCRTRSRRIVTGPWK